MVSSVSRHAPQSLAATDRGEVEASLVYLRIKRLDNIVLPLQLYVMLLIE